MIHQTNNRVIRVFISSTFRDMQAERDELVKYTFPQLRALCESRGVVWGEVDLRWGITDEEKAEGKVLPLCLEEIKNCRPYFIGLLGERYGWVPDEIPKDLIDREPWLREHLNHSVTELEILHGVLRNPDMAEHAFFYFRDPSYIDKLPENQKQFYVEEIQPEEEIKYGHNEAAQRSEDRKQKLKLLKESIRESNFPKENYPEPKALGELVLRDLMVVIKKLYPEGSTPNPLDREAFAHEHFARSRSSFYIGRQEYFDRLNQHVTSNDQPLTILGESGSGKSALLSNWALQYKEDHSDTLVIMHFMEATSYSANWMAMLQRIMGEFKRYLDIPEQIPGDPQEVKAAFTNWLHMAAARGRIVLIFDGLNQLEDRDAAPDLMWLPPFIPENIRTIVSTLPGRPLDEIKRREWKCLTVESLTKEERKELILKYLHQYSKKLLEEQMQIISGAPQTTNPLYLRALLEELRLYGDHDTINKRIKHYLATVTIDDLYEKILERYEQDYERNRPGLVKEAMSLIWASRRGLSEKELAELLGADGLPLPAAYWSPLQLAARELLVSRSGLLNFSHNYFRKAVEDRYCSPEQAQESFHLQLANYFEKQELTQRKLTELPWQLQQAPKWSKLYNLLSKVLFCKKLFEYNMYDDFMLYWTRLESSSDYRMIDAYRPVLDNPQKYHEDFIYSLILILQQNCYLQDALRLGTFLIKSIRASGNRQDLSACLEQQALTLMLLGRNNEAIKLLKEAEHISTDIGDKQYNGNDLLYLLFLQQEGKVDEAINLIKKKEMICREIGDNEGLAYSLQLKALIPFLSGKIEEGMELFKAAELISRDKEGYVFFRAIMQLNAGDIDEAMETLKRQERGCRKLGDKVSLSLCLLTQAKILRDKNMFNEAMELLQELQQISRTDGVKKLLALSLLAEAEILSATGKADQAMVVFQKGEQLCKELGGKDDFAASLSVKAKILRDRGRVDDALKLSNESEHIYRELRQNDVSTESFLNQAEILRDRGNTDEAMGILKKEEWTSREVGDKAGLLMSMGYQAGILLNKSRVEEAMEMFKKIDKLARQIGRKDVLAASLACELNLLRDKSRVDEWLELSKERENVYKEIEMQGFLTEFLFCQADILTNWGRVNEAIDLFKETEAISRRLGKDYLLAASLCGQANLLRDKGTVDVAMEQYKEAESICRKLEEDHLLAGSLIGQGTILINTERIDEAMEQFKEGERICRKLNKKELLKSSLMGEATILCKWARVDDATNLLKEAECICREYAFMSDLSIILFFQAAILLEKNSFDQAMKLFEEKANLSREFGDKKGLSEDYYNMARLSVKQDKIENSINYLKKAVAIGYSDSESARRDNTFASLRNNNAFKAILKKMDANKKSYHK